uniref:U1-type domain-containing protein n=1 Tax=Romanomermis culicivorax TaxID=13658 RepID=A0A915KDD0_ROMCU
MSTSNNGNVKIDVFEVVESDEEEVNNAQSTAPEEESATDGKEFHCPQCDVLIIGSGTWSHHLESRFHKRCIELDNEFIMNEDDLFVDDESSLSVFLADYKGYLPGLEFIIEDRTANDIKCILCRALLKSNVAAIDHVKTHKHQLKYLTKLEPGYVKSLRQKCLKNYEMSHIVDNRCSEILRRLGRQKSRVHEKNHEEKKRQKILNLVAKQISKNSETKRISNGVQVDDLDEMPKSAMITKTLLMAKIETFPDDEVSYVDGQRDHQNYYNILVFPGFSKERKDELIDKYCREIEESCGRSSIRSRAILPPDGEFVFKHHRKIDEKVDNSCVIDADVKVLPPAAASFLNGEDDDSTTTSLLSLQKQRQKQIEAKEKIAMAAMIKPVKSLVPKPPPGFLGAVVAGRPPPINTSLPPPGV